MNEKTTKQEIASSETRKKTLLKHSKTGNIQKRAGYKTMKYL